MLLFMIRMQPVNQTVALKPIAVSLLPPRERPSAPTPQGPKAEPIPRVTDAVPVPKVAKPAPIATEAKLAPRAIKAKPAPRVAKAEPTPSRPAAPAVLAKQEIPVQNRIKEIATRRVPTNPVQKPAPEPAPRKPIQETTVVAERPLPTLKDLLPSAIYSAASPQSSSAVNLNTSDPIYISYFTKIKQNIEQNWEYPDLALRYGLQGRLSLQFTIDAAGYLDQLRLIQSSGSHVLDQEALRAIKAAAPFPPIPSWIKPVPLTISASMEYHDNRLNYPGTR